MRLIQILLLPVSWCYGFVMMIRNLLFDMGVIPTERFDIPVISIGNLSMGGTGKTPHIEYLVRLLKERFRIATLSRGYRRVSKGFLVASKESDVQAVGDEPLQYAGKFDGIVVAVETRNGHTGSINCLK